MKRLLILLILCLFASSAYAQSGVALDAWKRSKDNEATKATVDYVDGALGGLAADLAQGNRVYYCTAANETIGGVIYGLHSESLPPEVTTVAIGQIIGTTFAQYSPGRGRISPVLGVTTIPAGVYNRVAHMSNNNTSGRNVEIVYELWQVDASGTTKKALLATSSAKIIDSPTGSLIQRLDNEYIIVAPVTVLVTDRLMEEFYFRRVGLITGTGPTITRYVGGNRAGFLNMSLPSGVTMLTDGSNSASTTKLKGLELSGGLVGLDANFEMDATAEQGFLLASSADSVPDINGMLFVNHGAIWDGYPIYHSSQQSSFSLWYNTSESKWWISASPGSLSAGWESSTLEGTYTALSAVGSVAISWEPISIAGAFGEGASAYDLAESRMATDFSNADAGVNFVDDNEKSTIASLTLNMMTWSGSLASGATSLATTKKFDSGILFVGGLIYDLADATVVTLNQAGVNTVIEFASPIVGDKLCVLLILK